MAVAAVHAQPGLRERTWYRALVFAGLGVLLLAGMLFAIGSGTLSLSPGQVAAALTAVMVLFSDRIQGALMFMNGAMTLKGWSEWQQLWPYSVAMLTVALFTVRRLDVIVLGDDVARGLGMNVQANRLALTAVAALLAASAVSAVGLLGFVGLIVPHIVRLVVGTSHALLIPGSIVLGAALVTISDTVSRTLFSPVEIPVGIMMAVLGVPFFLFLLRRAL